MHFASATKIAGPERVIIVANPRAGAGTPTSIVSELADALWARGLHVQVETDLNRVAELADRAGQAGTLRALVAAGGDGTVAELVNRTAPGVPISVFPLGTANLLAGYLGIRPNIASFCETMAAGATVNLDAGRANGRIFLLMAGCGFDGEVVERLHRVRGAHISMWSYAKPILDSIRSYEYPELRIYCDSAPQARPVDEISPMLARWAFVANLPCYAGGLRFTPEAVATDGLLNVCSFRQGSLWHGLRYLAHVWAGQHAKLGDCDQSTARRVRIESDRPVRFQLDGDPGGMLPLDIEVLPGRLALIAPPRWTEARTTTLSHDPHEVTRRV